MKAIIDETGALTITAESPMESYALRHWQSESYVGADEGLLHIRSHKLNVVRVESPLPERYATPV